jgi:hypothetical protein
MHFRTVLFSLFILTLFSCNRSDKPAGSAGQTTDTAGTYYPIKQLIDQQIKRYYGEPYALSMNATINGKKDSAFLNMETMDWASIIKVFRATDISDKKYIGHYNYSEFLDNTTGYGVAIYEAKDPDLFTRQLQITADPVTMEVFSVYIETAKSSFWRSTRQRLLYKPLKIIQIQEDETPLIGSSRKLHIDYRFL